MLKIAFVIMLLLAILNVALFMRKVNIVRLSCFSIIYAAFMYILVSGMLFWIDAFSVPKAVLGVICVQFVIGITLVKIYGKPIILMEYKVYAVPALIVLVSLPLIWQKYGFYGMGQDEGVYQNHAIQFMYGQNDVQRDFSEYHDLETEEEKAYYKQELHHALTGYYFYDTSLQTTDENNKISDISGTIHGIPTFAAILALWGRLFGLVHMLDIQTVFYVCAVFLIYILTEELKFRKTVQVLATTLLAISPVVLWAAKSSLTEMFIVIIIEIYLYGILNYADRTLSWWAVFAIIVFSFYHITNYTIMPIFIFIYWGLCLFYRDNYYIGQCIISMIGACMGLCMSCYVAPAYTIGGIIDGRRTGNFKPLYNILPWINETNVLTVIIIASITVVVISIIMMVIKTRIEINFRSLDKAAVWLLRIIMICAVLLIGFICFKRKTGDVTWIMQIQMSTFVSYSMATGGIILLVLCILWILKTDVLIKNMQCFLIAVLFVYCILVYCIALKPQTGYFYYYGRYLTPYISILLIGSCVFLNQVYPKYSGIILVASIILLVPYLSFFINERDDTQLDRETLLEIDMSINDGNIVIMNSETGRFLYLPVRTMNGCEVYFAETDLQAQAEKLSERGKNIYYITMSSDIEFLERKYNVDVILRLADDTGENCEFIPNSYFSFPVRVTDEQTVVSCYMFR